MAQKHNMEKQKSQQIGNEGLYFTVLLAVIGS